MLHAPLSTVSVALAPAQAANVPCITVACSLVQASWVQELASARFGAVRQGDKAFIPTRSGLEDPEARPRISNPSHKPAAKAGLEAHGYGPTGKYPPASFRTRRSDEAQKKLLVPLWPTKHAR